MTGAQVLAGLELGATAVNALLKVALIAREGQQRLHEAQAQGVEFTPEELDAVRAHTRQMRAELDRMMGMGGES